jgi:hypothetical protein
VYPTLLLVDPSPIPVPTTALHSPSFTDLVPLVTGAGGALIVLMLFVFLFVSDRITTVGAVTRLREADNNRFNDMVAQRDSLVKALEQANTTSAAATESARQSLELLREAMPPRGGRGGRA